MTGSTVSAQRLAQAIAEVTALLERTARYYPADLPVGHHDRHRRPRPSQAIVRADILCTYWFNQRPSLERHIEVSRSHAEALLVSERLNETILGAAERDELTRRALGILPGTEAGRIRDIFACPEARPRAVNHTAGELVAFVEQVSRTYGLSTALAYGQFIIAGLREEEELVRYGERLDMLFTRIVSTSALTPWLAREPDCASGSNPAFAAGLAFAARAALWQMRPERAGTQFLLTQVIDAYLSDSGPVGCSLGLALFDAIVLDRLGLQTRFLIADGVLSLVVEAGDRSLYWEVTTNAPLYEEPPRDCRDLDLAELFAVSYGRLGGFLAGTGRWDKACDCYRRALELKPQCVGVMTEFASCWLRRDEPREAIRILKQALLEDRDSAEVWHLLANAYTVLADWPRAMDAFRHALRLRPDSAETYNNMGIAYTRMGDVSQAAAAFEAALEHQPDYYQAHFNLGNLFLEQQEIDRAIEHYRAAVRIEPGFTAAHYNLGRAYYEKHDLDAAIRCYQTALQLNPKHYGAWYNLGIAYRDKGMTTRAVEALEQAVALNPNLMR
ncbi:MAG: tetratricopeptide repeat protein [candidate division WOR-3 bacterium]